MKKNYNAISHMPMQKGFAAIEPWSRDSWKKNMSEFQDTYETLVP